MDHALTHGMIPEMMSFSAPVGAALVSSSMPASLWSVSAPADQENSVAALPESSQHT